MLWALGFWAFSMVRHSLTKPLCSLSPATRNPSKELWWPNYLGTTALGPRYSLHSKVLGENGPKVENNCTHELLISGFQRLGLIEINKLAWSYITLV